MKLIKHKQYCITFINEQTYRLGKNIYDRKWKSLEICMSNVKSVIHSFSCFGAIARIHPQKFRESRDPGYASVRKMVIWELSL